MFLLRFYLLMLLFYTTTFSFHITPTFFEQRIDKSGGYQEFILTNNSTKTQRFKVTALPGTGRYNGDSDKWIEYSPKIITIKPQSKSVLKVFIKAPKNTEEGEYSSFLNFVSVPVPELEKSDGQTVAAAARMGLDVSIEIIGYVGNLKPKLEIVDIKTSENSDGKTELAFKVKNNTDKRGVWYNVDVLRGNENYESMERGRIGVGKSDEFKMVLKDMKRKDIVGVRLRESSTYEEITKKKM